MLGDFFTQNGTKLHGRRRALKLAANGTVSVPKGVFVRRVYIRNRTANAVTGGIKVGTTSGGTELVAAQAVAANAVVSILSTVEAYNASVAQTLYIQAVTAWNSAVIDVVVEYEEVTSRQFPADSVTQA